MSKNKVNGDRSNHVKVKKERVLDNDEEDEVPLSKRVVKSGDNSRKRVSKETASEASQLDKKKIKKEVKEELKSPKKPKKEEDPVWEWWKEEKNDMTVKWSFLEHNGPMFFPPYEPLPSHVKLLYDGKPVSLRPKSEEVATFYAKMYDHDYTKNETFNANFWHDWKRVLSSEEQKIIKYLDKCNFKPMQEYFQAQIERRKAMTKEEKDVVKKENEKLVEKYGYCTMDKYKQKIGNFRIEPPGLFRGRGNHPKMGSVKKRINPSDIIINCSKNSVFPQPPPGTQWKEIRHDPKVTWLACWTENVQNNFKYIMLNAASRLKGEKDWTKYETARRLHGLIDKIRTDYNQDLNSHEMKTRQRAVALYFIDKLALRAGNEKGDEEADTVGCCSLRVEHIFLSTSDDDTYNVKFDFLGKDSIRYFRDVAIPKKIYKNLQKFVAGKAPEDDLFDRLNTTILNQYLRELMPGLTAKVFRTYNASLTLEKELEKSTKDFKDTDTVDQKIFAYNCANREVALLCNHQRAVPKTFDKTMENIDEKIAKKKDEIIELKTEAQQVKEQYRANKSNSLKEKYEKLKKRMEKAKDMLSKLEISKMDKMENKDIALGTSKLNYLDPRISIAWCKKNNIPLSKVFSKAHLQKFQWAVDMAQKDYKFSDMESDKNTNQLLKCDNDDEEEKASDDE